MTVSVMYGQQVTQLQGLTTIADVARASDRRLWLGQSFAIDTHDALAALAGTGRQVAAGVAVAVTGLRTPTDAALRARSVASLLQRPVCVGFGIGSASAAAKLRNGAPVRRPASHVRDYVRTVRALLDGDDSTGGLALPPMPTPPVEVGCGVLRPRMAALAGEVANFAVTWLAPLPYLATTLMPAIANGARSAGRPTPRIVSVIQCAVRRADRSPAALANIACGTHLTLPHYRSMLQNAGITLGGDRVDDLKAAVRAGLFCYGSAEEVANTVTEHLTAGVDEVVLNTGAVDIRHGAHAAAADLEEILGCLGEDDRSCSRTAG